MYERNPQDPPRAPADPARVLAALGRQMAAEEIALGHASDEEIEAYVDGTGDPTERLLFEERLARDPALAAVVRDLAELRAELETGASPGERPAARLLPFRRPEVRRRLGWVAAAAAAVLLALIALPAGRQLPAPEPAVQAAAPEAAPAPAEPQRLFADGFENGATDGWTVVSSGG